MSPLILPLLDVVGKTIERIFPDKAAAEKAKAELLLVAQTQEFQTAIEQIKLNAEEAKNPNVFVSGWRPFIGWVCGIGLAYNFLLYPILTWAAAIIDPSFKIPSLQTDAIMGLTMGMLGMAGWRTLEKVKSVARE